MSTPKYLLFFIISLFSCIIISKLLSDHFDQPTSRVTVDMAKSENPSLSTSDHHTIFIVHMAKSEKPSVFTSHHHWYNSIIDSLPPSDHHSEILYTYDKVANGFSASLSHSQAAKLKEIPGVLHVTPDQTHKIQTTHSYKFLGLSDDSGIWPTSNYGEDIIIGVIDSGITPGHRSFSDTGLSPVSPTWRGKCEVWDDFPASSCNRKLIGARAFLNGYLTSSLGRSLKNLTVETRSPRDTDGHGTHVASIIAGAVVRDASFFEYAKGIAVGIAPKARIAAYKVCSNYICYDSDILAGMDQAVNDGVDIISMSLTGGTKDYYQDASAIASFGAAQFDVLVSVVAGNHGPEPFTVNHVAPWVLTTGSSSINRELRADLILGDSRTFVGSSLYAGTPFPPNSQYQLVYAGDFDNSFCRLGGFLNPSLLAGKIVVCEEGSFSIEEKETAVYNVNAVGLVIANSKSMGQQLDAEPYHRPGVRVGYNEGNDIKQYIRLSPNPTATILFQGTIIGNSPPAPKVASNSGRGPNRVTWEILKPDVIAPGLNILAAWTPDTGPWGNNDPRRVEFNVKSGTSVACPHVSGIAALLKSVYPNWSAAAIKSAIITTAYNLDNSGQSIKDLSTGSDSTPFAHGAGHVDPNRALDPGLVYDISVIDYIGFLCSIGYDYQKIAIVWREPVDPDICDWIYTQLGARVKPGDLNLPTFFVIFTNEVETVTYRRIVTNVGSNVNAVYMVSKYEPTGIKIDVVPNRLVFSNDNPKQKYEITLSSVGGSVDTERFGWIEWSDGTHHVRSTIGFGWFRRPSASFTSI